MGAIQRGWKEVLDGLPEDKKRYLHNHPPSFLDDNDIIALQAADMHAGWAYDYYCADVLGMPVPSPPWGYDVGQNIVRLTWAVTEESALAVHEQLFGYRPVKITWTFRHGMA